MNAIEMAEDFGMAILNSQEYQGVTKAQENLDNDTEAQKLIQEFQQAQMVVHQARHNGEEVSDEQLNGIKDLQSRMMENDIIKEFLVTKQNYEKFMANINRVLMKSLGLTLGEAGASSGCDCSSCG